MRAPHQAGAFPFPGEVRLPERRPRRRRARRAGRARWSSASTRTSRATSCRPTASCRCPTRCRRRAPCSPPTSRRRSTASGTPSCASAIASPSSAPASSAAWSPISPARIAGTAVELVDVAPARAAVAARARRRLRHARGGARATPTWSSTPAARPPAWPRRSALAGAEATVVEMSWYGDRAVELPLGGAFHSRRLTIRSSQVGGCRRRSARAGPSPPAGARAVAARPTRRSTPLIDGESAFEELPAVMPRLAAASGAALCHRVRYRSRAEGAYDVLRRQSVTT